MILPPASRRGLLLFTPSLLALRELFQFKGYRLIKLKEISKRHFGKLPGGICRGHRELSDYSSDPSSLCPGSKSSKKSLVRPVAFMASALESRMRSLSVTRGIRFLTALPKTVNW